MREWYFFFQYEKTGNRSAQKLELGRAQQTISQLQSNLNSVERIRKEIREEDVEKFDRKLSQTRSWIVKEINDFAELDSDVVECLGEDRLKMSNCLKLYICINLWFYNWIKACDYGIFDESIIFNRIFISVVAIY